MVTYRSEEENSGFLGSRITINWEVMAYIAILLIAIFTRFYILGDRVMSHDESLHTRFSHDLYEDGNFDHTPLMHGPILFHATALSYALFGDTDFSARIYTAVLGVLMVLSPLLFRRWLGKWGALLASIMLLVSPLMMYYHRYIRHDTPSMLSALLMIWGIFMYLDGPPNQKRRAHWLYVIAAAMIWNLGSKETAFIYVFIIGVFLFLYWLVRLVQHFLSAPGKRIFNITMIGTFFGGVASLGMYIVLDIIQFDMLPSNEEGVKLFSSLSIGEQQTFFVWTALVIFATLLVIFTTLFWAYRDDVTKVNWGEVLAVIGVGALVCIVLVVIEELSHLPSVEEIDEPLNWLPLIGVWVLGIIGFVVIFLTRRKAGDYDDDSNKDKTGRGFWGTMDLFPEFDLIVVIGTLILPWATAIIPFSMNGTSADFTALAEALPGNLENSLVQYIPVLLSLEQVGKFIIAFLAWLPLMSFSIVFGLMWNWKRWLLASAIFHGIFAFFFTTAFTNIDGLGSGMYYSLGYWLEQQGERRGNQPQYYYLLIIQPFYEFLPVIGSVLAMFAGSVMFWRQRKETTEQRQLVDMIEATEQRQAAEAAYAQQAALETDLDGEPDDSPEPPTETELRDVQRQLSEARRHLQARERLLKPSLLIFFAWLAILNLVGYSLAGEKMPWLGTHLSLPMIFLTAWFFGMIFERISWPVFKERGWLVSAVLGVLLIAGVRMVQPLVMGQRPFAGLSTQQLDATYSWLAATIVASALGYGVYLLTKPVGWRHLRQMIAVTTFSALAIITFRSAWIASFINYDLPTEYLVYAHAAPAVKTVLEEIEDLSLRTTDSMGIRLAYDNEVSWPYSWYFRDFDNAIYVGENPTVQNLEDAVVVVVGDSHRSTVEPILEDRYYRFDHMRLWWPMQEYFFLNTGRINNLLDFSPGNPNAAQLRQGIFDIWWSRDYSTYGEATEKDFTLSNWPVSEEMSFYVRKDYAVQIWPYGVGDGTIENPLDNIEVNVCTSNWQPIQAQAVLTSPEGMVNPLGIDIADDGTIYVAEEFGHRLSQFDAEGNFVQGIGREGTVVDTDLVFQRPNSVDIAPDGRLVVADTWNFRIQILDENFNSQISWGQSGTFGFDAPQEPTNAFWGPRDVVIDAANRVFVSDTGNKRVRVYDVSGPVPTWLYDIGEGGSGLGQLNEPSGLAVHSDGRLFVADTWNRRIAVFTSEGDFLNNYRVRGWYDDLGNRPYMAIDEALDRLYVTDPDVGRVLVYDTQGNCIGSFGQGTDADPNLGQLGVAAGIAVDAEGFVYVVDNQFGRILKFEPFTFLPEPIAEDVEDDAPVEDQAPADDVVDDANEADEAIGPLPLDDASAEDEASGADEPGVDVEGNRAGVNE